MLSEVFWVAFITTMSGCLIKVISMAYKSKCKEVECCCMKIVRDVALEEKENEFEITHRQIPNSESKENNTI